MMNRISRFKTTLFANTCEISLGRALPYTASHRQTEGEPVITRRVEATAYILEHVEISIHDEELIVGNCIVKPRVGIVSPEMDPYWLLKELDRLPARPQDRSAINKEGKRIYREELFPYWEKRSMKDFINEQMTDEVKAATSTQIFGVSQTDKDQEHIITDYPRLLSHELGELVAQMQQYCQQQPKNHFYQATLLLLETSQKHILRYTELTETMAASCTDGQHRKELLTIVEISRRNAEHKPQTFRQAYQLFWYTNIVLQYESSTSLLSLGHFDQYILPSYQASLAQDKDPASLKGLLESLQVKCNDIVLLRSTSSVRCSAGFPTGYITLLGGLAENGHSAVNVFSFLCPDAYQSVQLLQPSLGVRTNALIDMPFLTKIAETIRLDTGISQIFSDEVVVPAFLNRGVSLEDARDYSVVGCVELPIPGRTCGLHDTATFNLLKVMEICLHEDKGNAVLTYEGSLKRIRAKISHYITPMVEGSNICNIGHRDWAPVPLLSSFISDCLEEGRDITDDGTHYNFSGVQGIGIANLNDSLRTLKGMILDQQRLSSNKLLSVLKANFATPEDEKIRACLTNRFKKYGNDIDEVDNINAELLRHYCKEVEKYQNPRGGYFMLGPYTISAHVPSGSVVDATPDGRFAGEQLADGGLSPMLDQDARGPTTVLKSVSKLDNTLLSNGTLLNVRFTPVALEGEAGLCKLASFLRAFAQLRLQHVQFNVVSADVLREAQQYPQDHAGLVACVAGCSAFFVELSKGVQDNIIRRTAHQL